MLQTAYLRHLANFATVVEAGSMSGAAEQLNASPSAMSESVKILENYYGQPLLERRRSGVTPTSAGLAVYEHSRDMSAAASRALDIAGFTETQPRIRISMPVELAGNWFHSVFQQLQSVDPTPLISVLAEDEILDHDRYSRDLFIRVSSGELPPNINVLAAHKTRSIFVAHQDLLQGLRPNQLRDIQKLPLLCKPQTGTVARMQLPVQARGGKRNVTPDKAAVIGLLFKRFISVSDTQARIAMSRNGIGAVGCIYETMKHDIESGAMVALAPNKLSVPLQVQIASPHKSPSPFVIDVASRLASWMKQRA